MMLEIRTRLPRSGFDCEFDTRLEARGGYAIIGPSGSGKTSLLRFIAGLEKGFNSFLAFDGNLWQDDKGDYLYRRTSDVSVIYFKTFCYLSI